MTLVGNSAGGLFSRQILNGLSNIMRKEGYDQNTIDFGLRSIHLHNIVSGEPLKNKHHNTGVTILDIKDHFTTSHLHDLGWYPDICQNKNRRIGSQNPNILRTGKNSLLIWTDVAKFKKITPALKQQLAAKIFSPSIIFHISPLENGYSHPMANNALMCSILTQQNLPPIEEMINFDIAEYLKTHDTQEQSHSLVREHEKLRQKELGIDAKGFPIYFSDIHDLLFKNQDIENTMRKFVKEKVQFKATKATLISYAQKHYGKDMQNSYRLSKRKAQTVIGQIIIAIQDQTTAEYRHLFAEDTT